MQKIRLNKGNQDEEDYVDQYFFIDSRNKIQILYPNYDQKVESVKTRELISIHTQLEQNNPGVFKKISYIDTKSQGKLGT